MVVLRVKNNDEFGLYMFVCVRKRVFCWNFLILFIFFDWVNGVYGYKMEFVGNWLNFMVFEK